MWVESRPGPSRCQPSRQGYCGYCRVLYSNLDQHLSSLRHLDSVRASSRGSSTVSSSSSQTRLTLLERFLQDVLQHHPHHYNDPRYLSSGRLMPTSRQSLPLRCQGRSLMSYDSLMTADRWVRETTCPAPTARPVSRKTTESANQERESQRGHSGETVGTSQRAGGQSDFPHRAHTLTTRASPTSSATNPSPRLPGPALCSQESSQENQQEENQRGPKPQTPDPQRLRPGPRGQVGRPGAPAKLAGGRGQVSSDHSDALDRTIEEVIQMCCYGVPATSCQQEDTESFHFSLPVTMETQSDEWDSPVQVVLQRAHTLRDTPVQVSQAEGRDLGPLMDVQVDLEDQVYSHQLDSTLHSERKAGGVAIQEQGFWTLPIEQVLPAPAHIPESFRGKNWTQIEQEDEEKVEELVRQFRRGRFICYFDSESLARYGRRGHKKKGCGDDKGEDPHTGVLPLLGHDDNDSVYERRRRRRRRRSFRMASRCQVVKVSHSTQTVRLVVPAVRQAAPETTPTSVPAANQSAAEQTPKVQTWRCLPQSYSNIITPVQPRTSLVYLLCSPSSPAPSCTPTPGSTSKRSRKKRRPLDLQGLKVKYKRLPVRFYDPSTNRILKDPPKGFLLSRSPAPSGPPPPCVRQLFRSLSPDLNSDRTPGEGPGGSSRVKGHTSADPPFSHASSFLLSTLSKDAIRGRGRTSKALPPTPHRRPERGRGVKKERTRPHPSKKRTRAQTTPSQPRREGLRRSGAAGPAPTPPHSPSTRRGRAEGGGPVREAEDI
ncbi:hypothetical protein INR49_008781 [Caranx melampygus]|nr:hypothetical protein INR49_008781 [Caranx melampygus]